MSEVAEKQKHAYGMLTDEGIAKLRRKIGIQYNKPAPPHNYEMTWDGSRHFAFGIGDENPLWCDPEHGKSTRWNGLIGHPGMIYTMGEHDAPAPSAEEKPLLKGDPLVGLGSYQAQMDFEWWRPVKLGDRLKKRSALVGVQVNDNSSFSGRSVSEIEARIYRNQDEELVAIQRGTWIRAERHASKERKKEYELPEPYTAEQLSEIDAAYEAEKIRGAAKLYFEDVVAGEAIPTVVRGPMRTSDLIVFHIGWGMQLTPPGAFRLSYKIRKKAPGLFTPNPMNVPDTVQRLHWEKEWANELGVPLPYDYGALREIFLMNLVTNWMGDDAWLWKLSCQHRKFVYTSDTYWMKGKVREKKQVEGRNEVHLDIWVENQWGTVTTPGQAVVLLPSRSAAFDLPQPPRPNVDEMFEHEVARLHQD